MLVDNRFYACAATVTLAVVVSTTMAAAAQRRDDRPAGEPTDFPFFTIWRRADASAPWRYVAE
jgi:hypothetical protein